MESVSRVVGSGKDCSASQNNNFIHRIPRKPAERGIGKDLGAGVSLVLGVLSTQTYAQACLSGRSDSEARKGALISAFMIPPIGVGGILIGMYMPST